MIVLNTTNAMGGRIFVIIYLLLYDFMSMVIFKWLCLQVMMNRAQNTLWVLGIYLISLAMITKKNAIPSLQFTSLAKPKTQSKQRRATELLTLILKRKLYLTTTNFDFFSRVFTTYDRT